MNGSPRTRKSAATNATQASSPASPFPDASPEAKRLAAAILEVLAGTQGPSETARALGISLARYYQLEMRALGGLVASCEGRRRGQRPRNELASLRRECEQLRRECSRQQALVRATRRTVGLAPSAASAAPEAPKRRRRRPVARALKMAALLHDPAEHSPAELASLESNAPASPASDG